MYRSPLKQKSKLAYYEARRNFKALRNAKIGAWRKTWRIFWDPLSSWTDPRVVRHFVRKLFGEQSSEWTCSVEEITEHFEDVGELQDDLDFASSSYVKLRIGFALMFIPTIRTTVILHFHKIFAFLLQKSFQFLIFWNIVRFASTVFRTQSSNIFCS